MGRAREGASALVGVRSSSSSSSSALVHEPELEPEQSSSPIILRQSTIHRGPFIYVMVSLYLSIVSIYICICLSVARNQLMLFAILWLRCRHGLSIRSFYYSPRSIPNAFAKHRHSSSQLSCSNDKRCYFSQGGARRARREGRHFL